MWEKQPSPEMVSTETALFLGGEQGLFKPCGVGRGFLSKCTSLAEAWVLGMLHLHKMILGASWIRPHRERRSLPCNLATRLQNYLKGGKGGGHKAYMHQGMQAESKRKQS